MWGGLWKAEGVRFLIEGFAEIHESYPDARLVIAGRLDKGPKLDDVEAIGKQLGIQDKMVLTGWLDTCEVVDLLSAASIVALPQANDLFSRAALPTKLSEYSAMGKAILATRVGDVPAYFTHLENAYLCEPDSQEELAEGLRNLLRHEALRDKLGKAAKLRAYESFDYRTTGKAIAFQMQQVMNERQNGLCCDNTVAG